jgi:hypothetical protein
VIPNQTLSIKLTQALSECEKHWMRLDAAQREARGFGSIDGARIQGLSDAEVKTLDQLLFRFAKLQDAMGARLFPVMLQMLGEWKDDEPFIDKLDRLEKLDIIERAETWMSLRELRNQAAHEYPDQPEVSAAILTRLLDAVSTLGAVFAKARAYLRQRFP